MTTNGKLGKAHIVLSFNDQMYSWFEDWDDDYTFLWKEGNYSCDCNRSIFIDQHYPGFPAMDCGHQIILKELTIE